MTVDHALCLALRKKLQEELGSVKIYLSNPPQRQYPLIILQPIQIKSSFMSRHKRIVLTGEIAVQALQQHLLSSYGQMMVTAFETTRWRLEDSYHATLRLRDHEFIPSDKQGICTLKQVFEAFIHP